MVSKYFTVRLICKTKFPDTCHDLKNNLVLKGLTVLANSYWVIIYDMYQCQGHTTVMTTFPIITDV